MQQWSASGARPCDELLPVKVVTDGNITTARGMGASIELGLELVKLLISEEKAQEIGLSVQYLEK